MQFSLHPDIFFLHNVGKGAAHSEWGAFFNSNWWQVTRNQLPDISKD
jgi:hypothetical protein